ncbi:MAG: hypothetical protein KF723_20215 [Rhizobiaceae bacterium]|nr:hypothetical protein [Rhizobiaceae bacterium]
MIRIGFLIALAFAPLDALAAGGGPSFDCTAAMTADEGTICSSPELAEMDLMIAEAYPRFRPEFGNAREIARALLADRRACGDDAACIGAALYNALDTFVGMASVMAWVPRYVEALLLRKASNDYAVLPPNTDQSWPKTLGQCAATRIRSLTDRTGKPLAEAEAYSGTVVEFTNDGMQVSYGSEPALLGSEVGHQVSVCLIAIPRDCPPGDGRGRLYLGINHYTQGTWLLSDTQHMCGGA